MTARWRQRQPLGLARPKRGYSAVRDRRDGVREVAEKTAPGCRQFCGRLAEADGYCAECRQQLAETP